MTLLFLIFSHELILQSAVTIYVPYDGVVKELMYEVDDIATKGKPLMMIEVEGDVEAEGTCTLTPPVVNY